MSIAGFLSMLGDMGTSIVKRAGVSGDLMGGIAATSKTIGATTDDFVNVFGKRASGEDYSAGLRSSLDTAYRDLDDATLKTHFESGGPVLDEASFNEMKMAREYFLKRQEASQYDSRASFEAVQRNIREGGNPNAGYSRAGETRPESALTRIFDTEATGMGNELKFLGASALLGGGANYMTGGEFGTGAGVGAIAATGIRGAGRIIQQNMPEIETVMMKRLMGDDYSKLTHKAAVSYKPAVAEVRNPDVTLGSFKDKTIQELINEGHGDKTFQELGFNASKYRQDITLSDYAARNSSFGNTQVGRMKGFKEDTVVQQGAVTTPASPAVAAQAEQSVRTQALNAIQGMSAEQVKERGIGSSYIQKMLTNKDKGNMGRNMRVMTVSGAALAGVPFTGRRNDHSSGFNKNRGNKI
jgi:hypothetical protein